MATRDTPGIRTKRSKVVRLTEPIHQGRHCILAGNPKHGVSKNLDAKGASFLLVKDDKKRWATPTQRQMLIDIADNAYPPKEKKARGDGKGRRVKAVDPLVKLENEPMEAYIARVQAYAKSLAS